MQKICVYQPETRLLSAIESLQLTNWVGESLEYGFLYLLIDLKRVSFMDSRGLGALLIIHNRVEKAGGVLGLCGLNGQAQMLLDMTSTSNIFHIFESPEAFQRHLQIRNSFQCCTEPVNC